MARRVLAKHPFRIVLSFGLTIAICVWLYGVTDWEEVAHELRSLRRWDMVVASAFAFCLQIGLRGMRWAHLLPASEARQARQATLPILVRGVMMGNFGNYFLPLRAGELMRPYLVAAETRISFMTCLASTIVERFFDLFTVLVSFGWVLARHQALPPSIYTAAYAVSVIALGILGFVIVCARWPRRLEIVSGWLLQFAPNRVGSVLRKLIADVIQGTQMLRDLRRLGMVLVLSALIWLATFWQYQLLLYCFDLPSTFSLAVTITVLIALAIAAPSSPGFIGVFEFACVAAFALYGQSRSAAVSYAIVAHMLQYVIIAAYGLLFLARAGLLSSKAVL